jgi:hypothetical protein
LDGTSRSNTEFFTASAQRASGSTACANASGKEDMAAGARAVCDGAVCYLECLFSGFTKSPNKYQEPKQ